MHVMGNRYDIDDEEEEDEVEEASAPRRSMPRFGPFVTIAAAILMLFGAASQVGKTSTGGNLFQQISMPGVQPDEVDEPNERVATARVTIGARPVPENSLTPSQRHMRLDDRPVLPPRNVIDQGRDAGGQQPANTLRPPSHPVMTNSPLAGNEPSRFDPAPEAATQSRPTGATYVVATGDNWKKVEKQTGKRWQDIQKANPESKSGLRVGMRLVIP